jgi:malonyl CoA-acyl carrier protein transacylase
MYIFPGQGSQYVGMGSDIYEEFAVARSIYGRASDALGYDVAKLSFHGPQDQLDRTEFTQPALLTHSIACLEIFRELGGNEWRPSVIAGHSLGEYSALVAADALIFEDALKLVQQRGRLMSEYGRGKMVAFRLDLDSIKSLANSYYCDIGGCNLPDQTVVCGYKEDLDRLITEVQSRYGRAKSGRYLNTEGAFHTYLMIGAAEQFRPYLEATPVHPLHANVLSNYTGKYHSSDPAKVRASLFFQIFHPVKWMWGLQRAFADGVNAVIEFGGGIGRDKPGVAQASASRKPNLEGITRKSMKDAGTSGLYLPAINSDNLKQLEKSFQAIRHLADALQQAGGKDEVLVADRSFHLYIPVRDGITDQKALELINRVLDAGLGPFIRTITEPHEHNVRVLQSFRDASAEEATPYLEVVTHGTSKECMHYCGEDIDHQLDELRNALTKCGYDLHREGALHRGLKRKTSVVS